MVLEKLAVHLKVITTMNADKPGRRKGINGIAKPSKPKGCVHQRMVESHLNENGQATGNVVCLECGAVLPYPMKAIQYGS